MNEPDEPGFARGVRTEYRRVDPVDAGARERLLDRIRRAPRPRRDRWPDWARRAGGLTPLRSAMIAAGVLALIGGALVSRAVGPTSVLPARSARPTGADQALVRFELAAPGAAGVTLVGDFNDWDTRATPMRRSLASATWTVSLPVARGRHVYSFVVDGRRWVPDPAAPLAPEDGFGSASSVILVAGMESS
jgi:predicted carbohydrate-binding protein with CBM48